MVILDMDCFVPEETAIGMLTLSEKGGNNAYKFTRRAVREYLTSKTWRSTSSNLFTSQRRLLEHWWL